jgi:hypothetical protein
MPKLSSYTPSCRGALRALNIESAWKNKTFYAELSGTAAISDSEPLSLLIKLRLQICLPCQNGQKQNAYFHCSTVQIPLYIDVPDHLPAS